MSASGPRIAIVDDDDVVRRALRRMIASLSFEPVEFSSGEEFITALPAAAFDCALIDLHMPGMNGTDVVSKMRRDGHKVPTIIITGGDMPKLRERCLNAGASAYMVKPIERGLVNEAIRLLLS